MKNLEKYRKEILKDETSAYSITQHYTKRYKGKLMNEKDFIEISKKFIKRIFCSLKDDC